VVEDRLARNCARVVQLTLTARGHREADTVGDAGAQRAGGALDALGVVDLGVARRLRTPRAQRGDVFDLEPEAREEQLGVLGERRVASRQDEPVPTEPVLVGRVDVHDLLVEQVRERRQRDRRAWVTVTDLLHRIRCEHTRGIDRPLVEVCPGQRAVHV
jgi:hypothetical protein